MDPSSLAVSFMQFIQKWEFGHMTSLSYHSHSNSKVELAVKMAKTLLMRAAKAKEIHGKPSLNGEACPIKVFTAAWHNA